VVRTLSGTGSRLWAPARNPAFRLLWIGQSLSLLGGGFSYIAFAWTSLSLTSSTLTLGTVLAAQAVPRAVLTLVGGSLSDTWSSRRIMVLSSWARAVVMTATGLAGLAGVLTLSMLFVSAAVFGAVDAFFQPARSSILPSVVDEDVLAPANALLGAGSRIASVIGPAIGGVVVAVTDADWAFLADGVCFALCGLCVSRIRELRAASAPADEAPPAAGDTLAGRIRAGIAYALTDPRIRTVLVVDTVVTFCYAGPFTVGFAYLAKFQLEGGSATLGVLNGILAGGALLGALAGGAVGGRPSVGLLIAALAGWLTVGMLVLGLTSSVAVALAAVGAMGFAIGFQGVFGLSWIQRTIDGSVLSRVVSVDMVLGYAIAPLSLVLCGALVQTHSALMFGGTGLLLALTGLGVLTSRPVRTMR
jgi:Transmembrane secretion effector